MLVLDPGRGKPNKVTSGRLPVTIGHGAATIRRRVVYNYAPGRGHTHANALPGGVIEIPVRWTCGPTRSWLGPEPLTHP